MSVLASHRHYLGCSKIAQALDVSRFGTANELAAQYLGIRPWAELSSLAAKLGEPMEAILKPFAECELGASLRRDRREYRDEELRMVAHLDYRAKVAPDSPYARWIDGRPVVDIKTSLGFASRERFGDEVDWDVQLQMQGYLMMTGAPVALVVAMTVGPSLKIYEIEPDPQLQAMIRAGVARFWSHIDHGELPAPRTLGDADIHWPTATTSSVNADADLSATLTEYRKTKAGLEAQREILDALELRIKTAMAEAETILVAGKVAATWRNQTATRIETKRLKEEMPDIAARFSITYNNRVFRLKGEKQ